MSRVTRQIAIFVVLTALFSAVPEYLAARGGLDTGGTLGLHMSMWTPALAAFATCAIFRVDIGSLGWSWQPQRWVWISYALPMGYALPVYLLAWISVDGAFAFGDFATATAESWGFVDQPALVTCLLGIPTLVSFGIIPRLALALGEEIGWRGFLLPRLVAKLGFTGGCAATGLIWGIWHLPAILLTDYAGGVSLAFGLPVFFVGIVVDSFTYGWIRLKAKSLWPAAVMHASFNLFTQRVYGPMTSAQGFAEYLVGEFGFGLTITTGLVALYFWRRRGELEIPTAGEF